MLNARKKTLIAALLLMLFSSQVVRADAKLYQYDGKLPFVQMMLSMMAAMGIIDRLPTNGRYGMKGYPSSPWSQSSWSRSPWSSPTMNDAGWDRPNWGVLPVESYARSPYGYGSYGSVQDNRYWSDNEVDGWVNEPWETSSWNPKAEATATDRSPQSQATPLVQNFNYNAPAPASKNSNNKTSNSSPLTKLAPKTRPSTRSSTGPTAGPNTEARYRQPTLSQRNNQKSANKFPRNQIRQKPCITEFCGLKKPNLNGLWVAQDGEMLGIKNNRYLWNDSSSRYLTGKIKIQNEYLVASVEGSNRLLRFKYKLARNHLLTMQPDGKTREFTRVRTDQYNNYARGGYNAGGYGQRYYP